jgi:uroporphyrin-III C-methyltransferase/precorrin-2 dehydrogenase/sirohydrochlorin ferrochelatase
MTEHVRTPAVAAAYRMGRLARLPLFFAMTGRRAVVAGGNAASAWKAKLLAAAGASVDIYTREPSEELLSLEGEASDHKVRIVRRDWQVDDLRDATIAVGVFDDDIAAGLFATAARAVGVPVNVVDRPAFCDFSFGSIVNRSPLVIGISTDGAAPIFAQAIRAKIEALLPQVFSRWVALAAAWRHAVKASRLSFAGRRNVWQRFTARAFTNPDRVPCADEMEALIDTARRLGDAVDEGSVTFVDAGPGNAEFLTLGAVRALHAADAILYDESVSPEVLEFARREARKILVARTKPEEVSALMAKLAKGGRRVVRLNGRDPLIFAERVEEPQSNVRGTPVPLASA